MVLNGDIILDPELLGELVNKYTSSSADTMMVLTEVDDPSSFGVVEIQEGLITNIVEKPAPGEAPSNLINTGIYVFNQDILSKIEKTGLSPRGEYEITDSLQMQIDEGKKVGGLATQKKWIDVGRPWELLEINEEFLDKMEEEIQGHVEPGVNIEGRVVLGKNSIIRSGTYIQGPVYIGENCDIGPNSYLRSNTYLGNKVSVGNAVEIKNTIVMDNTNINHLSYVGDSIIGANCNLAAGTNIANLRFDDRTVKMGVKEDRVDTGRRKLGVVFGDGVKTGINSSFNPGVKVGINSAIGSGTVIYKDIDSHKIVLVKQEYQVIDKNMSS
jgi:bifunctional UDP-N-acetylglucosamine pyrophosphorylase/glucosamine-1-phosphate N-acetyltransferase